MQVKSFSAFGGDRWTFAVAKMEAGGWKTLDLRCACLLAACALLRAASLKHAVAEANPAFCGVVGLHSPGYTRALLLCWITFSRCWLGSAHRKGAVRVKRRRPRRGEGGEERGSGAGVAALGGNSQHPRGRDCKLEGEDGTALGRDLGLVTSLKTLLLK